MVERERSIFNNTLLPAAIDAIVRTRGITQNDQYIETQNLPNSSALEMANISTMPEQNLVNSVEDWSRTSLASFVKSKGMESNYDFILCAVYYNLKRNGVQSFSSVTLKDLFAEAKRPAPQNLSRSLSELVKKGLIMEDGSAKNSTPKVYVLTFDGEEAVEKMHPTDAKEKKTVSKPRKQRPKKESPYFSINLDDLNLSNYPDVKTLKDFKEKMMLILYIVTNENQGEWFTTADVLCLMTDIFGESATERQVKGVFERETQWFKSEHPEGNKKIVQRKLLNGAKQFAQSLQNTAK